MDEYSKKVMALFKNPKNMGEVKNADGAGEAGNPVCGDVMRITIKVKDGRLADIKFKTMGCVAAIAASSMITELAKGKTIQEAMDITNMDVAKELGGLPNIKMHCSKLAADALRLAINDYQKRKKR